MDRIFLFSLLVTTLAVTGCERDPNGHYVPASNVNGLYLVDTWTGKTYELPIQYREGGEPQRDVVLKWKLKAEF